jgi:hypothetical protein
LQWIWFRYIAKCCNPGLWTPHPETGEREAVTEIFQLKKLRSGRVECRKRAGMSENIQIKARNSAEFVSAFDAGDNGRLYTGWELDDYEREREQLAWENERRLLGYR